MSNALEEIRNAILGRYPIIYIQTWEEERAVRLLESLAGKLFKSPLPVTSWTCIKGFTPPFSDAPEHDTTPQHDATAAVQAITAGAPAGFYLLKDFAAFLDEPQVQRALRDAYQALRQSSHFIFLIGPDVVIPMSLSKEIFLIELGLPSSRELMQLISSIARAYPSVEIDISLLSELPAALKGLTLNEAYHTLQRIYRSRTGKVTGREILDEVFNEKANIVRKSGLLEFVRPESSIETMGGLDNLKDWLVRRQALFSRKALDDGIPVPKGMLVMGMSGCGKSFAAKAVSALWKLPLFRLDMSLVFSGSYGTPEAAFHRALRTIEALAPGILWIDEIENSLGMDENQGETNHQIFSAFLTWMQEKPPLIFVAATANRIAALPAEIIRKGRFDQIYFVDLPSQEEREQIFNIHIARNGGNPAEFDIEFIATATQGWSGSEIEQAVIAARVDAYAENRPFTIDDIASNTADMVALSTTMAEQMKHIRAWAFRRATPASKYGRQGRA